MQALVVVGCLVAIAVLPHVVTSSSTHLGICGVFGAFHNSQIMTDANIQAVGSKGEYAVVAWDPYSEEASFTCARLTLNLASNSWSLRYKDASGAWVAESGSLTTEVVIPLSSSVFRMDGISGDIFGNGRLYMTRYDRDSIRLLACRTAGIGQIAIARYFLAPVAKAALYSNCNCDDWSATPTVSRLLESSAGGFAQLLS